MRTSPIARARPAFVGLLVAGTLISSQTIWVEPALNIPNELIDKGLDRLADALKEAVSRD